MILLMSIYSSTESKLPIQNFRLAAPNAESLIWICKEFINSHKGQITTITLCIDGPIQYDHPAFNGLFSSIQGLESLTVIEKAPDHQLFTLHKNPLDKNASYHSEK